MLSSLRLSPRLTKLPRFFPLCSQHYSSDSRDKELGYLDREFKPSQPDVGFSEVQDEAPHNANPLHRNELAQATEYAADGQTLPPTDVEPGSTANMEKQDSWAKNNRSSLFYGYMAKPTKAKAAPGSRMLHRHCLITGGSSGIGYAIAKRCIEEGATSVAILSRTVARAARAIERIKQDTGLNDAPIWAVIGNLYESSKLEEQLQDKANVNKNWMRWNTLVNCAAESQSSLSNRTSAKETAVLLRVNLEAPITISKLLMNLWARRRAIYKPPARAGASERGEDDYISPYATETEVSECIVNVSSLLAVKGGMGASTYAATKAGLLALTRSMVLEAGALRKSTGPPLRVNAVLPGYIDTPMLKDFHPSNRAKLEAEIPLGRFGVPEEVADAVIFLISNEYANNCMLNLDGGLSAT